MDNWSIDKNLPGDKLAYLIGVSGGPDSMFLMDNLRCLGYKFIVAHVNYKKRKESDNDEELVRQYCQKFNLSLFVYQMQPKEYLEVKNFQAWARIKRYDFFQSIAQQNRIKHVIVAHHLDDHLETYCYQKERNSLVENWGLATKSHWKNIYILRPLLFLEKKHIYRYLAQKNVPYAVDYTNYLSIYQRNVIRKDLEKMSQKEKLELLKEVQQKNQELNKTKEIVQKQLQEKVISDSLNLDLRLWNSNLAEVKLRLLYYWINKVTNKEFVSRKKRTLWETKRQLESPKNKLTIKLNKSYQVQKRFPWAVMEKN